LGLGQFLELFWGFEGLGYRIEMMEAMKEMYEDDANEMMKDNSYPTFKYDDRYKQFTTSDKLFSKSQEKEEVKEVVIEKVEVKHEDKKEEKHEEVQEEIKEVPNLNQKSNNLETKRTYTIPNKVKTLLISTHGQ
jgi:hypothetical protein